MTVSAPAVRSLKFVYLWCVWGGGSLCFGEVTACIGNARFVLKIAAHGLKGSAKAGRFCAGLVWKQRHQGSQTQQQHSGRPPPLQNNVVLLHSSLFSWQELCLQHLYSLVDLQQT